MDAPIMIDPRDFGRLEAEVKSLQEELASLRNDVRELLKVAERSRGGFAVVLGFGALVGTVISWAINAWSST